MTIAVATPAELAGVIGATATGEAILIDQARIDAFAEVTEDRQWIHVDPERAASGPFGTTIAHGYLTLSLLPALTGDLIDVGGTAMVINYGLDRIRFLRPVPSGTSVRAQVTLNSAEETPRGWRAVFSVVVEAGDDGGPALSADMIALFMPEASA